MRAEKKMERQGRKMQVVNIKLTKIEVAGGKVRPWMGRCDYNMGYELLRRVLYCTALLLMVVDLWATEWARQLQARAELGWSAPVNSSMVDVSDQP
jgi:hypothetical protein